MFADSFERVKRIHLTLDAFSVENGCLTPTLKIRRQVSICALMLVGDMLTVRSQERDVREVQALHRRAVCAPRPDLKAVKLKVFVAGSLRVFMLHAPIYCCIITLPVNLTASGFASLDVRPSLLSLQPR